MKIPLLLTAALILASSARAAETRSFKGRDAKSGEDVTITLNFDDSNAVATFKSEAPSGTVDGVPGKAIYDCGTVTEGRKYSRAPWGGDASDAQIFNQAAKCWKARQASGVKSMRKKTFAEMTPEQRKKLLEVMAKAIAEKDKFYQLTNNK